MGASGVRRISPYQNKKRLNISILFSSFTSRTFAEKVSPKCGVSLCVESFVFCATREREEKNKS